MSCECDFEESLAGTRLGIESNFIGCKMKVVFLFVRLAEEKHQQRRKSRRVIFLPKTCQGGKINPACYSFPNT